MKARLKGAQTGRNLLKKKSDALSMRFRQILRKIIEVSWCIAFILSRIVNIKHRAFCSVSEWRSKSRLCLHCFFLRRRLKWVRWCERQLSHWLKPNLQLETSGKALRQTTWHSVMCDVAPSVNPTYDCVHSITVIQNVNKAQVKVRAKKDNVAG